MKILFKLAAIILLASSLLGCQERASDKTAKQSQAATVATSKSMTAVASPKSTTAVTAKPSAPDAKIKIGIIVPLEHKALNDIVSGFSEKLPQLYDEPVEIKVMNAQGDQNLQRAIIQQMQDQNYDLIVPITTSTTQMTVAMIHNKPIVSIAAQLTDNERQQLKPCNVVVVHDEISPRKLIEFFHTAFPKVKNMVLIHSTVDKVLPDVKTTVAAGKQLGIEVKPIMVATLPELISATQSMSDKTQAIFILKDSLIASGIPTLVKAAADRHIPLFTSDQGTVQNGAGFSLAVHERAIGEEGAELAAAAILGDELCSIPNVDMRKLTVFMNKGALQQEQLQALQTAAEKLKYQTEEV